MLYIVTLGPIVSGMSGRIQNCHEAHEEGKATATGGATVLATGGPGPLARKNLTEHTRMLDAA